jgi:hypothetical protein
VEKWEYPMSNIQYTIPKWGEREWNDGILE